MAFTFSRSARACSSFRASSRRAASALRTWPEDPASADSTNPARSLHSFAVTGRTARFFARSSE
ncbi:MAG: hypothetical protein QM704_17875 [Anaeromyxobacteraceae bacterium]